MRTFRKVFESVGGITISEAIKEFEGAALFGFRISDLDSDEQRAAFGLTLEMLHRGQRENHELKLADIPHEIEAMRPKMGRVRKAIDALLFGDIR